MHYMLLIYAPEHEWQAFGEDEKADVMRRHEDLERDLRETRRYHGCGALASCTTATTVRVRDGRPLVTDGPFAEAREQLGGYYLVEASDLDDAIAIAARIPGTAGMAVEVRPVQDVRF